MPAYRVNKINEEMLHTMTNIIRRVKDPRINNGFLSITSCDVTPDLKYAKIYYSLLGGDLEQTKKGFLSASGFIRREIAENLNLRATPELTFIHDTSTEHAAKISNILKELSTDSEESKNLPE